MKNKMLKSELKQLIKEEIQIILNEEKILSQKKFQTVISNIDKQLLELRVHANAFAKLMGRSNGKI